METSNFSVLIDADALVALIKVDDTHHSRALRIYRTLKEKKADLFMSNMTIPEVSTVISNRMSQTDAKKFLDSCKRIAYTEIALNPAFAKKTSEWFAKQKDKRGVSYFDCFNLALMETFKFDAVFSFDHVYKDNGFTLAS